MTDFNFQRQLAKTEKEKLYRYLTLFSVLFACVSFLLIRVALHYSNELESARADLDSENIRSVRLQEYINEMEMMQKNLSTRIIVGKIIQKYQKSNYENATKIAQVAQKRLQIAHEKASNYKCGFSDIVSSTVKNLTTYIPRLSFSSS